MTRIYLLLAALVLVAGAAVAGISSSFSPTTPYVLVFALPLCLLGFAALPGAIAKIRSVTSRIRWWQSLWFLLFLSGLVVRTRTAEAATDQPLDFWAIARAGLVGLVGVLLLLRLFFRSTSWARGIRKGLIGAVAGYALISLVSSLWSVFPLWTAYKSIEYLVDIALIAAVVETVKSTHEFKRLFDWTWVLVAFLAVSIWIGIVLWPSEAVRSGIGLLGFQVSGVLPVIGSNGVGDVGAILALVAVRRSIHRQQRGPYPAIALFGLATLLVSYSRTPMVGFLLAVPFALIGTGKRFPIYASAMAAAAAASLFFADTLQSFLARGQSIEEIRSLSSRVHWWAEAIDIFLNRPMGYGAYAGTRFYMPFVRGVGLTSSIDSDWVETIVGTGVLGFAILFVAVAGLWGYSMKLLVTSPFPNSLSRDLLLECLPVLAYMTFRSFFVTKFFVWHPPLLFLLVLGYVEFTRRAIVRRRRRVPLSSHSLPRAFQSGIQNP